MSQNSELDPKIVEHYASTHWNDLSRESREERLDAIHLLNAQMFNQAAKHARPKSALPLPCDFPNEYEALTNLAKSFSHSKKFEKVILRATDHTIMRIEDDKNTLSALRIWKKTSQKVKEVTLDKIVDHFMSASRTLFNVNFAHPDVQFYQEEMEENGDVTQGYYTDMTPKDIHGIISLNMHKDAFFNDPLQAACTALHESVHAVQNQIDIAERKYPDLVKKYKHDAQLVRAHSKHNAIIDFRLDKPYRAQFHEILAFEADERFHQKLEAKL